MQFKVQERPVVHWNSECCEAHASLGENSRAAARAQAATEPPSAIEFCVAAGLGSHATVLLPDGGAVWTVPFGQCRLMPWATLAYVCL